MEETVKIPVLNLRMVTEEEELALVEECKRKHPERYTAEAKAEARKIADMPCGF